MAEKTKLDLQPVSSTLDLQPVEAPKRFTPEEVRQHFADFPPLAGEAEQRRIREQGFLPSFGEQVTGPFRMMVDPRLWSGELDPLQAITEGGVPTLRKFQEGNISGALGDIVGMMALGLVTPRTGTKLTESPPLNPALRGAVPVAGEFTKKVTPGILHPAIDYGVKVLGPPPEMEPFQFTPGAATKRNMPSYGGPTGPGYSPPGRLPARRPAMGEAPSLVPGAPEEIVPQAPERFKGMAKPTKYGGAYDIYGGPSYRSQQTFRPRGRASAAAGEEALASETISPSGDVPTLDQLSGALARGKKFKQLSGDEQKAVLSMHEKLMRQAERKAAKPTTPPPKMEPPPGAAGPQPQTTYGTRWGGYDIVEKTRRAKDANISEHFREKGLTPDQVQGLSLADWNRAIKEINTAKGTKYDPVRAQEGRHIHRSFEAIKGDIARAMKGEPEHFAEGGIVTKPTKAIIGEKGPEAVIPLKPPPENPLYARDPVTRLRALQGSEDLKDALVPAVANAFLAANPMVSYLDNLRQGLKSYAEGDYPSALRRAANVASLPILKLGRVGLAAKPGFQPTRFALDPEDFWYQTKQLFNQFRGKP